MVSAGCCSVCRQVEEKKGVQMFGGSTRKTPRDDLFRPPPGLKTPNRRAARSETIGVLGLHGSWSGSPPHSPVLITLRS